MINERLSLYIVDRKKAAAAGFSHDDCVAYIDMIGAWLSTVGIPDYSYGNIATDESKHHPAFSDALVMYVDLPDKLTEEAETLLGGMEMSQNLGASGPLALENQDPKIVKIALAAWNVRQKFYRDRMEQVSVAVANVHRAFRGNLP